MAVSFSTPPSLPVDGEVLCVGACQGRTKLNRTDLLCWRCGGDRLDRSGVEEALARSTSSTGEAPLDALESRCYWTHTDWPDTPGGRSGCLCPEHKGQGYPTARPIVPGMESFQCLGSNPDCHAIILKGQWVKTSP